MTRATHTTIARTLAVALAACACDGATEDPPRDTGADVASDTASDGDEGAPVDTVDVSAARPGPDVPGPYAVGAVTRSVSQGDRTVAVTVWYPAATESAPTATLSDFATSDADRATLDALRATGDPGCFGTDLVPPTAPQAAALVDPPLIFVSHCHQCARFSFATIATRLASHGFVVAAPDHVGDTVFDAATGVIAPLDAATLALRTADIEATRAALQSGLVADLGIDADGGPIGLLGHSFGAVTVGAVAQADPLVRAVAAIAAPMENPAIPGVSVADIDTPSLMVVAEEDNSITVFGNRLIEDNFERISGPSTLVTLADVGHFAFSDLCGLSAFYTAGCGAGRRQTTGAAFTYLAPPAARERLAAWTTAFFLTQLAGIDQGEWTQTPRAGETVVSRGVQ